MKKKFFKRLAVATTAIALIGLATTVGTMAKYMSSSTGTATVDVAKWEIVMKSGTEVLTEGKTLQFDTNTIVPGTTCELEITVENLGEVSADVTVTLPDVDEWLIDGVAGTLPEGMTIQMKSGDEGAKRISYEEGSNSTTFAIVLEWTFDNEENNRVDNQWQDKTISGNFTVTAIQVRPEAVT